MHHNKRANERCAHVRTGASNSFRWANPRASMTSKKNALASRPIASSQPARTRTRTRTSWKPFLFSQYLGVSQIYLPHFKTRGTGFLLGRHRRFRTTLPEEVQYHLAFSLVLHPLGSLPACRHQTLKGLRNVNHSVRRLLGACRSGQIAFFPYKTEENRP